MCYDKGTDPDEIISNTQDADVFERWETEMGDALPVSDPEFFTEEAE